MKFVAVLIALALIGVSLTAVPAGYTLGWGTYGTALVQWSTLLVVGLVILVGYAFDGIVGPPLRKLNDKLTFVVTVTLPKL